MDGMTNTNTNETEFATLAQLDAWLDHQYADLDRRYEHTVAMVADAQSSVKAAKTLAAKLAALYTVRAAESAHRDNVIEVALCRWTLEDVANSLVPEVG